MNNIVLRVVAALICLTAASAKAVTINVSAGVVRDNLGQALPDGTLMMLMSAGPNGTFGNVTSTAFSDDPDDIIIPAVPYGGTFAMDSSTSFSPPNSGIHIQAIVFNFGDVGLATGQKLRLMWFSGLTPTATQPGPGRFYGVYRSDAGVDGSAPWQVPPGNGDTIDLNMLTVANGGSIPDTTTWASNLTSGVNQFPVAVCKTNVTVVASGAACEAAVSPADVDDGSSDPDGEIVSRTLEPPGPYAIGNTPVTLIVQDDTGQTGTCATVIIVTDTAPAVACPVDITAEVTAPGTEIGVSFTDPAPVDNCDGATVVCVPSSGSLFSVGVTTVTCTATDLNANSSACTFDVTVVQVTNLSPLAVCQDITVSASATCDATVSPDAVDNGSSDPDGVIVDKTLSPAGPYPLGDSVVTLTVTDDQGATATCSAVITVQDDAPPSLTCPATVNVIVSSGQSSADVTYVVPASSDNCSTSVVTCVPVSGSTFALGDTVVTCTATDTNSNSAVCTFTINVTTSVGECQSIDDLVTAVDLLPLGHKTKDDLVHMLDAAKAADQDGDAAAMRQELRAFIRELRRLRQADRIEPPVVNPVISCAKILVAESITATP